MHSDTMMHYSALSLRQRHSQRPSVRKQTPKFKFDNGQARLESPIGGALSPAPRLAPPRRSRRRSPAGQAVSVIATVRVCIYLYSCMSVCEESACDDQHRLVSSLTPATYREHVLGLPCVSLDGRELPMW